MRYVPATERLQQDSYSGLDQLCCIHRWVLRSGPFAGVPCRPRLILAFRNYAA